MPWMLQPRNRKKKSLGEKSSAGNETMIPQLPKSQPIYFANYAIQPLLYTIPQNILILTNGHAVAICCIKQTLTVTHTKYMVSVNSALSMKSRHQFVVYTAHSNTPYTPNTIILNVLTLLIGCDWYITTSQSAY